MEKIFGIGVHRTGTSSLRDALGELGIKIKHFFVVDGLSKKLWKLGINFHYLSRIYKLLEEYDGLCDFPVPVIFKKLDKKYPNSKFILTVRSPDSWIRSVENHIKNDIYNCNRNNDGKYSLLFEEYLFYNIKFFDKKILMKKYLEYNKKTIKYFKNRPNDLLVIDFSEGDNWKKICSFLNKKVPNKHFPCVNKRF
jgi:hypothetical protein